jgi:hypothetical protein
MELLPSAKCMCGVHSVKGGPLEPDKKGEHTNVIDMFEKSTKTAGTTMLTLPDL